MDEQMEQLRLIKDYFTVYLSIESEELDLSHFDRKGGPSQSYDVSEISMK
jgi:type I restriction enzyme R subunit